MNSQKHFQGAYQKVAFYSPRDIKFVIYSKELWQKFLKLLADKEKVRIVDFGCGGGTALYSLEKEGYQNLFGIDFCHAIPKDFLKRTKFVLGDVLHSGFRANFFDGLVSTMVIEHVDEKKFIQEIWRVLKKGGIAFVTSVLKDKVSWYFYRNDQGETVIEPSHRKEYRSLAEYKNAFQGKFAVLDSQKVPLVYPLIDPLFKFFLNICPWRNLKKILLKSQWLEKIRLIRVPIPGYYAVEVLLQKK
jgi:ubiquinone/menaquinone biosynthesis C-methylase UbiE